MQVANITEKETNVNQLFEELYLKAFPKVARYVAARRGSLDDAQDIFQDALVVWFEERQNRNVQVSAEAYVIGIAKHLWARKAVRGRKLGQLADFTLQLPAAEKELSVNANNLLHLLETTGKKCMDLLRSWYHKGTTPGKIANELGYSSEHSASVQKYKCLEKVRDTIKEKSLSYEAFID